MTDNVEKRVREAFDGVHAPRRLTARTLARIEAERARQEADAAPPESLKVVPGGTDAPGTPRRHRRRAPLIAAVAACLVLALAGMGGVAWAWQPYAYVTIDVNPSIELGINRFDRVASTRAYNEDGERVLDAVDIQGDTYEQAMTEIESALGAYLDETAAIELTIICDDRNEAAELEDVGTRCLDAAGEVTCSHASEREHHDATEANMSVGKYRVWQALIDAGLSIPSDEAQNMTMRELLDLAAQNGVTIPGHEAHEDEDGHAGNGSSPGATPAGRQNRHGDGEGAEHRGAGGQGRGEHHGEP